MSNSTTDSIVVRRDLLKAVAAVSLFPSADWFSQTTYANEHECFEQVFETRGVVLRVENDLKSLPKELPRWAKQAGLTTIGTHITPSSVAEFVTTDVGVAFLEECKNLGIEVEHELHAMGDLLPRELFRKNPEMFRESSDGGRTADGNCCVHSTEAVEVIAENACKYTQLLPSTTGRYFYWMDDNRPMCACQKCRSYSASDQAVVLENAIIKAIRQVESKATLAHLAYLQTMAPPTQVKPDAGLFLEFAPIRRSFKQPLQDLDAKGELSRLGVASHRQILQWLDANLEVFPAETAQALEYWLDVSLFSEWKRPAVKLPWRPNVVRSDVATYAERGIRHVTSFANFIDIDYVNRFGAPTFLNEYGTILGKQSVNR